jgi:hypothetical protein
MFEQPQEWGEARRLMSVFKFYQQHTFANPVSLTGPNSYDALVRSGAFAKLTAWRIKIAIEVGSVKEGYCTGDASGMARSVKDTTDAVAAVTAAGGLVQYLAMDEPFLSGQLAVCGGPAMEPTADRLAVYYNGVHRVYPLVRIGLIEAYPSFDPDGFAEMVRMMKSRGATPAFVHVDVDLRAVRPGGRYDVSRDLPQIQAMCAAEGIPFGIIIWGYNGDADALFAQDAARLAAAFRDAFSTSGTLPDQFVFQSWSESSTGLRITPSNLPEDSPYTLTNLLNDIYRRFVGATSGTVGTARARQ